MKQKCSLLKSKLFCRAVSAAVIFWTFVFVAFCYFSFYYNVARVETVVSVKAGWDSEPATVNAEELPLRADVRRFLEVYFSQPFAKPEDKIKFVELETGRFSRAAAATEEEKLIQKMFVSNLQRVSEKLENGEADLSAENANLIALGKSL